MSLSVQLLQAIEGQELSAMLTNAWLIGAVRVTKKLKRKLPAYARSTGINTFDLKKQGTRPPRTDNKSLKIKPLPLYPVIDADTGIATIMLLGGVQPDGV